MSQPLETPDTRNSTSSTPIVQFIRNTDEDPNISKEFYELLRFPNSKKRTREKVERLTISPSGKKVAVLTLNQFWVFNSSPVKLVCTGNFSKKAVFKYGQNDGEMTLQSPVPDKLSKVEFRRAAMNDEYLAIGLVRGMILAFIINGDRAGRWVFKHETKNALVESLQFSRDGELFSLVRFWDDFGIHYKRRPCGPMGI